MLRLMLHDSFGTTRTEGRTAVWRQMSCQICNVYLLFTCCLRVNTCWYVLVGHTWTLTTCLFCVIRAVARRWVGRPRERQTWRQPWRSPVFYLQVIPRLSSTHTSSSVPVQFTVRAVHRQKDSCEDAKTKIKKTVLLSYLKVSHLISLK